jgi:hypothetical protein
MKTVTLLSLLAFAVLVPAFSLEPGPILSVVESYSGTIRDPRPSSDGETHFGAFAEGSVLAAFRILPNTGLRIGPGYRAGFPIRGDADTSSSPLGYADLSGPFLPLQVAYYDAEDGSGLVRNTRLRVEYSLFERGYFDFVACVTSGAAYAAVRLFRSMRASDTKCSPAAPSPA